MSEQQLKAATAMGTPVYCSHDQLVPIEKIYPNPENPNTHPDEQLELLAKLITRQGWRTPISVSTRSGYIVRGHARLEAAKMNGEKDVPVDYQDYDSDSAEYADLVADNRIAELAELDYDAVAKLVVERIDLDDFDVELTGYTVPEIGDIVHTYEEKKKAEEEGEDDTACSSEDGMRKPFGDERDDMPMKDLLLAHEMVMCMFSGGKDSIAQLQTLLEYGVPKQNIKVVTGPTPMDPPFLYEYILYVLDYIDKAYPGEGSLMDNFMETTLNGMTKEELLQYWEESLPHKGFPGRMNNWCNSIFKAEPFGQVQKQAAEKNWIVAIGNRGPESPRRARMITRGYWDKFPFCFPIFDFTEDDVLNKMAEKEIPLHPAYKHETRLSCMGCYQQGKKAWGRLQVYMPGIWRKCMRWFALAMKCDAFQKSQSWAADLINEMTHPYDESCEQGGYLNRYSYWWSYPESGVDTWGFPPGLEPDKMPEKVEG